MKNRKEYEELFELAIDANLVGVDFNPRCGKANCLIKDPSRPDQYREPYVEITFQGFVMALLYIDKQQDR